jgi:hypothetical protein
VWRTVCWILRIVARIRQHAAAAVAQHWEWHRERYGGSLRLAATLVDDPDAQKNTAVKEPSSSMKLRLRGTAKWRRRINGRASGANGMM